MKDVVKLGAATADFKLIGAGGRDGFAFWIGAACSSGLS